MSLPSLLRRLALRVTPPHAEEQRARILRHIHAEGLRTVAAGLHPPATLKRSVMARVRAGDVSDAAERARTVFTPAPAALARMRHAILSRIGRREIVPTTLVHVRHFLAHGWPRWVSVAAAFLIVVQFVPSLFLAPPIEAGAQQVLLPTEGVVSVTHGSAWRSVTEEAPLTEPLTIRTGPAGNATVVLGDTTVLRLGGNTELSLRDAAFADASEAGADAIARVSYGQLWVTSLLPAALPVQHHITFPQGTLALQHSSVNMLADPNRSTVQVFHRAASVQPTDSAPFQLLEGEQLTLPAEGSAQRHHITDAMRSEEWVRQNRKRDAVHRTDVAGRRRGVVAAHAGTLPTSPLYALKRAAETIDHLTTLGADRRRQKRVAAAQTRLHEAVVLLEQGEEAAAEEALAAYRARVRALAAEGADARALLADAFVQSSTTLTGTLPHSPLYPARRAVLEAAATATEDAPPYEQLDLYLLSDALLGIETLITARNFPEANDAFTSINAPLARLTGGGQDAASPADKQSLKIIKTILRSIAFSLNEAERVASTEQQQTVDRLQQHLHAHLPVPSTTVATGVPSTTAQNTAPCMSEQETLRTTNGFLAAVYTYKTPRAQRNEVLRQLATLPDCPQSARVLRNVMSKVPVFTRSFVWDELRERELL